MNGWTYVCLVVGLLFLAAPASALIPDDITLSTDKPWLVAGNGETATVTILVTNGTSADPVSGVDIDLAVDGEYGSISPARVTTGSDGEATATFRHGTLSGTATITATVSEGVDVPLTGSVDQQIDHAAAHKIANLWYEPKVTAGETTEIVVRMVDEYGNLVDSRNVAETVFFMVGSPACFVNGTDEITVPVDAAGNVTATLRVDTTAGGNVVLIQPPSPLVLKSFTITGEGGLPAAITQEITPSSGSVPADGKTKVSFTYTLLDEYGNPSGEQGLWVNATLKRLSQPDEYESRLLNTNSYGQVMITYGPEDSVGMAIITATAAVNESVSISEDVEFTSTDPTNMLLSASPQSMPSRDVKDDSVSRIRAKVMDVRGNPVEGETVTFDIVSMNSSPYVQPQDPVLAAASGVTDIDGYATVEFHPGAFTTDPDVAGWSDTATGKATVRATWGNVSRDIELTWKNYPYLSVETEVSPETVAVNDTVDVTIRLKGDGWALQPDPIDVVLCTDRSGSMLKDYPDRMVKAMDASRIFNVQIDHGRDRLGLVSFGGQGQTNIIQYSQNVGGWLGRDSGTWDDLSYRTANYGNNRYYTEYATLDLGLSDDQSAINTTIAGMIPDSGTPMRYGIYKAITELKDNGRSDAVKAVVVLGDGEYNYYGDPLARGTGRTTKFDWSNTQNDYTYFSDLGAAEQRMSTYANNHNVRLYMISFSDDIVNGSHTWNTMETLASETGGTHYHAPSDSDLAQVYTEIAGELKTEAGVDTELDVVFENVEVNGNLTTGTSVFDYVNEENVSTTIESWIDNETVHHYEIIPRHTRDDTPNWTAANPHLPFNIGTVRLGQTWETTFRLAVKTEGNINIFGPGSTISFNNGTDSLELPDTFITAVPLNNTGMDFAALVIDNLVFTGTMPIDEFLPVAWDLNYTGLYDVTEDVFYSNDNEYTWVKFDTLSATNTTTGGTSTLDVRGLLPGEYTIWVRGSAPDTADSSQKITMDVHAGATGGSYIRIQ
ncbi:MULTISPECIES: Ig-like domain-containing protein [Methanoculleus]|uniref:von Willebrand factor, type A n=2 Tax=Methanoculleus TaxID=45989 RepID=A3CSY6_METMJ|nr:MULTISPECIES: VWA domain-containing protein [Methanoculleus]ABN56486.1 von Willebrand factor, type A [Methanoculleus marisnigri JR1]UYU17927.1 VWA domain-containing protein [Methanoculleus submarinus]